MSTNKSHLSRLRNGLRAQYIDIPTTNDFAIAYFHSDKTILNAPWTSDAGQLVFLSLTGVVVMVPKTNPAKFAKVLKVFMRSSGFGGWFVDLVFSFQRLSNRYQDPLRGLFNCIEDTTARMNI